MKVEVNYYHLLTARETSVLLRTYSDRAKVGAKSKKILISEKDQREYIYIGGSRGHPSQRPKIFSGRNATGRKTNRQQ